MTSAASIIPKTNTYMNVPSDLKFAESHEWVRIEGDIATVGISDHAQEELTDVVFVEVPEEDMDVEAGDPTAVVESVKAASDIYSPVSGTVIKGNTALEANPALVNTDPYGKGWIFKIKMMDPDEVDNLLTPEQYTDHIS